MRQCLAIVAALPREVKAVVDGWPRSEVADGVVLWVKGDVVVVCAGMGANRAALGVKAAMAVMPVASLASVGLAGACDAALRVGDVVRAGVVVDTRTGERFSNSKYTQVLVSAERVAGVKEKARLYASYGAAAVDMEAAAVARLALAHGIDFCAIKSISDEADFEMEELARFATPDGRFREAAFAGYAAVRPRMWRNVARLAGNSRRAVESLTVAVEREIDWFRHRR